MTPKKQQSEANLVKKKDKLQIEPPNAENTPYL